MFELTPFVKRNHVATYDPFRLFDEMERSFFKGSELGDFRADIRDTGDAYELEADLPGVKKEGHQGRSGQQLPDHQRRAPCGEGREGQKGQLRPPRAFLRLLQPQL